MFPVPELMSWRIRGPQKSAWFLWFLSMAPKWNLDDLHLAFLDKVVQRDVAQRWGTFCSVKILLMAVIWASYSRESPQHSELPARTMAGVKL